MLGPTGRGIVSDMVVEVTGFSLKDPSFCTEYQKRNGDLWSWETVEIRCLCREPMRFPQLVDYEFHFIQKEVITSAVVA